MIVLIGLDLLFLMFSIYIYFELEEIYTHVYIYILEVKLINSMNIKLQTPVNVFFNT